MSEEVQRHLVRPAELARAEAAAVTKRSDSRWLEIDKQMEAALGEKKRAQSAAAPAPAAHPQ